MNFAQRPIAGARTLYAGDSFGVDLNHTVYALDATTIDLYLSVFPCSMNSSEAGRPRLQCIEGRKRIGGS